MAKILFALTNHPKDKTGWETGCYLLEVAVPFLYLKKNGFEIDFVSPLGGEVPVKVCDTKDPKLQAFFSDEDARGRFYHTKSSNEIIPDDYEAIFFPGGHGVMYDIVNNKELTQIARRIYENHGVVCAVCHGGAGLLNIKLSDGSYLIHGKKLTAFSNNEEEAIGTDSKVPFLLESALKEKGAQFSSVANWQSHVVVDGRLITGQNPASDLTMAKELVKALQRSK
ncbi:type 1 glutamine amidotransferase domain-containing protein [Ancylomarina longa]|uniref:Type 1 glutamine amidotransferase domain-containing protein n=1 Tax=Ancylomarina longa TaxID=2487017 RepID=A0A434AXI3_9BACT|nr:type 1 glutamine amidotransferase domain-containing protein [Ancylomarina longa]RUT79147.1 type 1 glutamine amidotransferase domain-containing protein [Ancylomarina longa]